MNQGEQNRLDQIWFKALAESVAANEMFTRYRFAQFVAQEERESCAKLLDELAECCKGMRKVAITAAANAIRHRK